MYDDYYLWSGNFCNCNHCTELLNQWFVSSYLNVFFYKNPNIYEESFWFWGFRSYYPLNHIFSHFLRTVCTVILSLIVLKLSTLVNSLGLNTNKFISGDILKPTNYIKYWDHLKFNVLHFKREKITLEIF